MVTMFRSILLMLTLHLTIAYSSDSSETQFLSQKINRLKKLSVQNSVVDMGKKSFIHYVMDSPRNYTIVVAFITEITEEVLESRYLEEEFILVAKSYRELHPHKDDIFFATFNVDFDEGIQHYLGLSHIPEVVYFPPERRTGPSRFVMNVHERGASAEQIVNWLEERSEIHFVADNDNHDNRHPRMDSNTMCTYVKYLGWLIVIVVHRDILWKLVHSRFYMGAVAMFFCWLMPSGQMWNLMNSPPVYGYDRRGAIIFYPALSEQYVGESVLIMVLTAGTTLGFLTVMNAAATPDNRDVNNRNALVGIAAILLSFSYILSCVPVKTGSYPYNSLLGHLEF